MQALLLPVGILSFALVVAWLTSDRGREAKARETD
jgi:hypothetical protein